MGSDKDTIDQVLSPLISALNSTAQDLPPILPKKKRKPKDSINSPEAGGSQGFCFREKGTTPRTPTRQQEDECHPSLDSAQEGDSNSEVICPPLPPKNVLSVAINCSQKRENYGGESSVSTSSLDYQSLSGESEMSISIKNSSGSDSTSPDDQTSPLSSASSPSPQGPKVAGKSSPSSPIPVPFTPSDLSTLLKQNVTPAELCEQSLEVLKSMEFLRKSYSVVMKDTGAEVDTSFPGYLLDGDTIVLLEKKKRLPFKSGGSRVS